MAPIRTRHLPSPLTIEIAKIIDGARAERRPRVDISELARQSGIERSMLSRMLKPEKSMLVDELVAVCDALGLDAGQVIDEARWRARDTPMPDELSTAAPDPSADAAPSETGPVPRSAEGIESTRGPKIVTPPAHPQKRRRTGNHLHGHTQ